jgi:hypothetical protein
MSPLLIARLVKDHARTSVEVLANCDAASQRLWALAVLHALTLPGPLPPRAGLQALRDS